MEQLIETVLTLLRQAGLQAVGHMPFDSAPRLQAPACAVWLEKAELSPAGFARYLGTLEDGEHSASELYGTLLQATVALRVYSPVSLGADACAGAAHRAIDALLADDGELRLTKAELGACDYDPEYDHFTTLVTVQMSVWAYRTEAEEAAEFTDFSLRGELE